ncbi:hypothetical protein [Pseudomonas phage D6]|nr:hypothetical protein [Pseudomonas phage D6]
MSKHVVPVQTAIAMFSQTDFYGFDHPCYLDVFVELGEDRDRITDLIANAIIQKNVDNPDEFAEMIAMQLGYMGIDADETEFYGKVTLLVQSICQKCSPHIIGKDLVLVEAIEDTEWVNIIYREAMEVVSCSSQPYTDLISKPGFQVMIKQENNSLVSLRVQHITELDPVDFSTTLSNGS